MKPFFLVFVLLILQTGCGSTSCELDADNYRTRACAIKVEKVFFTGRWFSVEGENADKGGRFRYVDRGFWYASFENAIELGDTLVKRKNELVFYIHKKDTVLTFPYECDGKVIK